MIPRRRRRGDPDSLSGWSRVTASPAISYRLAENIIVKVDTSTGAPGFGCAAPAEEVNNANTAAARHALDDRLVRSSAFDAADPSDFARRLSRRPLVAGRPRSLEMALSISPGSARESRLARVLGIRRESPSDQHHPWDDRARPTLNAPGGNWPRVPNASN